MRGYTLCKVTRQPRTSGLGKPGPSSPSTGMGTAPPSHASTSMSFTKGSLHGLHNLGILYIFVFFQGETLCLGECPSAESIEPDVFGYVLRTILKASLHYVKDKLNAALIPFWSCCPTMRCLECVRLTDVCPIRSQPDFSQSEFSRAWSSRSSLHSSPQSHSSLVSHENKPRAKLEQEQT